MLEQKEGLLTNGSNSIIAEAAGTSANSLILVGCVTRIRTLTGSLVLWQVSGEVVSVLGTFV